LFAAERSLDEFEELFTLVRNRAAQPVGNGGVKSPHTSMDRDPMRVALLTTTSTVT